MAAGFDRVFLTILDTHVASLISAAFLFQFGTGPIRGFATTLTIGLLSNVFTAVFVSRTHVRAGAVTPPGERDAQHLALICASSRTPTTTSSSGGGTPSRCRWSSSWPASAMMVTRGLPLGIDFSGGTIVVLKFQQPVGEDALRSALDAVPGDKVVQQYGDAADNEWLVRLPQTPTSEQGASLEQGARAVLDAVTKANLGKFEVHQPGAGRPGHRRGPAAQGHLRHARLDSSASRSTSAPLPLRASRSARLPAPSTTCS